MLQRLKNAIKGFMEPRGFVWTGVLKPQNDPEGTQYVTVAEMELGDGKAEFLGEGTTEEFEEAERERKGFKNIFGLGKD